MKNEQQNNSNSKKFDIIKNCAALIATQAYALLHFLGGMRFLNPKILAANAILLSVFVGICPDEAKPYPWLFLVWGWGGVISGFVQRRKRWNELQIGETWHSYSDGIPYLSLLNVAWPKWIEAENRLVRIVEPLLVAVVGLACSAYVSRAFGAYLIIVAGAMAVFQFEVYERWVSTLLDKLDALIESHGMAKLLAMLDPNNPNGRSLTAKDLEGYVPFCISAGLIKALNRKQAEGAFGPDNLKL